MAYELKPGQFSLFLNDRKTTANHPDYTGNGMGLDGELCWISAWTKESKTGETFLSVSIKLKDGQTGTTAAKPATIRATPIKAPLQREPGDDILDMTDDIPF